MGRTDTKQKKAPAPDPRPRAYQRGWGVGWGPMHGVFGDGLKVTSGDQLWEIVPYVTAPGGVIAGHAIIRDGRRNGFTRVPGAIEQAVAIAELEIMAAEELKRKKA